MFEYEFAGHARLRTAQSVFSTSRHRVRRPAHTINTAARARDLWR